MWNSTAYVLTILWCSQYLLAGPASGTYRESGREFTIGSALAERSDDGSLRILLTRQLPELSDRDHHLDRLEALAQAAEGGYLMLEPTAKGDRFNITVSIEGTGSGSGGQYDSEIEFNDQGATGKIETAVLSGGELKVSFDAEYLPPRQKRADLPAGGGEAGAVLVKQMQAVASGDRDAILQTLEPEQQEQFAQMGPEELAESLSFLVDLTPRNVRVTGGVLYDDYAIVEFSGETDGVQATGRALVAQKNDQWRVIEVSTKIEG